MAGGQLRRISVQDCFLLRCTKGVMLVALMIMTRPRARSCWSFFPPPRLTLPTTLCPVRSDWRAGQTCHPKLSNTAPLVVGCHRHRQHERLRQHRDGHHFLTTELCESSPSPPPPSRTHSSHAHNSDSGSTSPRRTAPPAPHLSPPFPSH